MKWLWTVPADSASSLTKPRADLRILEALESGQGQWENRSDESVPSRLTRSQLQRLMDEGQVVSNGQAVSAKQKLVAGARIEISIPPPQSLELTPEERSLDILFVDEHILVVNKPPGLTVHPSETQTEGTLVHALLYHVKDLSGIGGVLRPGIVHRIDKDTSGALVITKSDRAHQGLSETFAKHEIDRKYWALCFGVPQGEWKKSGELRLETKIGRNPADRKKMSADVKDGRTAITYFRLLERYSIREDAQPFASWIEARLETGRTHQVRVHLTRLGSSLLGDPIYGTPTTRQSKWQSLPEEVQDAVRSLPGQALHARTLGFTHPITGQRMHFEAEPPPVFRLLQERLKRYLY